ncbi:hypothetical protein L226DRAFT_525556 [Lentinus tigrinus ALCF2SS1-7]|uniref:F-box domain-containing protein n=1 Tax=Lentinus tigrinus ALCF2SS1-6 TaxID=1328759 RepID=A0A5C2RYZ1_9APHY|nr:hypothetical protein L227DRAFT_566126 [Lentinus tigrinus ALCF2SS1-6]RPD71027.1 hypothetical protein L226DRAFT_525556 [Lentinus tigrinus ALCF2SS1-7]
MWALGYTVVYDTCSSSLGIYLSRNMYLSCWPISEEKASSADINSTAAAPRQNLTRLLRLANTIVPINRVPHEVLVMVFKHVTASDENNFAYRFGRLHVIEAYDQAFAVVAISQVCHHWRETTLEAPTLWTRIDSRYSPKLLEFFMARSQKAPISLRLDATEANLAALLNTTVPVDRSVRRLDLVIDRTPRKDKVASLATRWVAPTLECLTINSCDYAYLSAAVPLVMLDGQRYSMLKALALRCVGHWLPSNTFPSLTHLHLTLFTNTQTSALLAVLTNAPHLEFLVVGEQHYPREIGPYGSGPVVLSRLRYLTLYAYTYGRAMNLLQHLSLPEHCFVRLSGVSFISEDDQVDLGPLRHATKLDIASIGEDVLVVADSPTCGFWIQAECTLAKDSNWNTWLHGLPTMITLSTVTSLHINIHRTHTFWPSVLRHFSALVELKAIVGEQDLGRMCPLDTLCTVLLEEPLLSPLLCDLCMQVVAWDDSCDKLSSKLVDMAMYRARMGRRLNRFLIQTNRPELSQPHDIFGERSTELIANVDYFELVDSGPELCSFRMRDVWHVDGAERYWQLNWAQEYILPAE